MAGDDNDDHDRPDDLVQLNVTITRAEKKILKRELIELDMTATEYVSRALEFYRYHLAFRSKFRKM